MPPILRTFAKTAARLGPCLLLVLIPGVDHTASAQGLEGSAAPVSGLSLEKALQLVLERDFNIARVESNVEAAAGSLMAAESIFDSVYDAGFDVSDSRIPTVELSVNESESFTASTGWTRLLRSGRSLQGGAVLRRFDDRSSVSSRFTLSFTLRQPLLRGRGSEVTTATELAAAKELEARRFDLEHTVASRLRTVAIEYWLTEAARRNLEIFKASENRSQVLLETIRRLIDAAVLPRADLVQLEADLESRTANRISSERSLFDARQRLGLEIGLGFEESTRLPLPLERFPKIEAETEMPPAEELARRAGLGRPDVLAARARREAAEIRHQAAQDQLSPRLDLVLTPSYQSLEVGASAGDIFQPLVDGRTGVSAFIGLDFEWPAGNKRARGDVLQAQAAIRQSEIDVDRLSQQIGVLVIDAVDAVMRGAERLERISAAQELFAAVVENEEKKLRAGTSTLIDVISQSDRLTAAQQRLVSTELTLALAILELRFQSGTLVTYTGGRAVVSGDQIRTLPTLGEMP